MSGPGNFQRGPSVSAGFTLVEVLLSLGLAALVLMALATAVDVHLRCVHTGRTHVEEAQLARALLHRIADDLRNAAVVNRIEVQNLMSPAAATPTVEGGGANVSGEPSSSDDSSMFILETAEVAVGLYGESEWMQIDVCRTPRLDQYDYETLPSGVETLPDRVSEVKTIAYFLAASTGTFSGSGEYTGGLVRREIDRAVTRWAEEQGLLAEADLQLQPIAPEVTAIEFLYFDGSQWTTSWDSTEMGGLPTAVRIALAIMPSTEFSRFTSNWTTASTALDESPMNFIYALTVALPVAGGTSSSSGVTESGDSGETEENP